MHSPRADDLAPLPVFSQRQTSRVRGPRPSTVSWFQTGTQVKEETEGNSGWSWTCRQADLSRASTMCSYTSSESSSSNQSSTTSDSSSASSPCIDHTPSLSFDHESSRRQTCRPQRRKPSGPRPPSCPHSPTSPVRPTLSINTTSLLPPAPPERPVLPLPLEDSEFPHIAPTEPTTPAPRLPPAILFPPSELLDWDAIFELLGVEK
jgi:hypothetical protein